MRVMALTGLALVVSLPFLVKGNMLVGELLVKWINIL